MKNKALSSLASAFFLTISLSSQATIISGWGAATSAGTGSDCRSGCSDYLSEYDYGGKEFDKISTSEENTYGSAKALADLSGEDYLPVLKVATSATSTGMKANAKAYAVQGFNYLGEEATSFTLDINLHGSVGSYTDAYSDNQISADIGVLIGNELEFFPSFGTAYYEFGQFGDTTIGAGTAYDAITTGEDVNKPMSLSFDLDPGESFFVLTQLTASSNNGFADAWHTLTLNFQDSTNLQAVGGVKPTTSVPEPSTIMLILLALAFLSRRQLKQ